ncbi:MAG: type II secretion system protein [Candidatus Absconditabacteria bacterium]
MKKAGFTLIEMLFVLVIISMLVSAGSGLFKSSDKNIINAQSCLNFTNGFITQTINSAVTGKGIYSGGSLRFPDSYYLDLNSQKIDFGYSGGTAGHQVTSSVVFSGSENTSPYGCYAKDFYVQLTGASGGLNININILDDSFNPLPRFLINNDPGQFTGSFIANFCGNDIGSDGNKFCRPLGKFIFDRRTETVKYVKCLNWDLGGKVCARWSDNTEY